MKKLIYTLFVSAFLVMNTSTAQSLAIAEFDSIVEVNSTAVADYGFHIDIENVSSFDMDVFVKRAYSSASCAYDSGYFCWDYCYSSDVDFSIGSVQVAAGATKTDFSGHVYSSNLGAVCSDSTRYVFFDSKDPADSLSVWVIISAGPTVGTAELSVRTESVYPNPAKNEVTVEASRVGTFTLYNALGTLVRSEPLRAGKNNIQVGDLANGVYLYTTDGGSFKRLIVRH